MKFEWVPYILYAAEMVPSDKQACDTNELFVSTVSNVDYTRLATLRLCFLFTAKLEND